MKVTSLAGSISLNMLMAWLTRLPRMLLYWEVVVGSRVDLMVTPSCNENKQLSGVRLSDWERAGRCPG